MLTAPFYRAKAKRLRERAATCASPAEAEQCLRFARDHDTLADLLEASDPTAVPPEQQ